jgi:hypothetical protein
MTRKKAGALPECIKREGKHSSYLKNTAKADKTPQENQKLHALLY